MSQALVESHPKWNHDEFLCFLLLCAAMADMEFSNDEKKLILSSVDPSCLTKVKNEFDLLNDYERLNVISAYKEKFHNSSEQKAKLLVRIEELFEIDGTYTTTEHNLFMMLRKLL
jgi:hypothetical protein